MKKVTVGRKQNQERNALKEAQIEKMKCGENCKHHYFIGDELECHLLENGINCDDWGAK